MMSGKYEFVTNFRQDPLRRKAFNDLAGLVFGLDFEPWFRKGFWNDQYIPFTLFHGDKAVSNVSANRFTLALDGVRKKAIQFGTVMTHPDYRNQGLARLLMQEAIGALKEDCDLFYLMGDKDALGFYLKFGFKAHAESAFTLVMDSCSPVSSGVGRQLDFSREEDWKVLLKAEAIRNPVSEKAGVLQAQHLLAFHMLNGYGEKCYWIRRSAESGSMKPVGVPLNPDGDPMKTDGGSPGCAVGCSHEFSENDLLVIFEEEDETLHLCDVVSCHPVAVHELLSWLPHGNVRKVTFGFTPDMMGISSSDGRMEVAPVISEDTFFVLSDHGFAASPFRYPSIGLA